MGEDISRIEAMYDSLAEEYAEHFSGEHLQKPKDREILQRFSKEVGGKQPVWDLGCGPGHTARYLRDLGVGISGLDLSERLLAEARSRYPEIHFQKGNILDLDFANDSVAGIVSFYAMVHFDEQQMEAACREVYRVLEPGGLFLLTYHIGSETIHIDRFLEKDVDLDFTFCTTAFVCDGLTRCGFEKFEVIEREPYPQVEYQSRRAYLFATKPGVPISPQTYGDGE